MQTIISGIAMLAVVGLGTGYYLSRRRHSAGTAKAWIGSMVGINGLAVLMCAAFILLTLTSPMPVFAQTGTETTTTASTAAIGAGLATGLACIGCGIAVGIAGAAAIGSITEKPEVLGKTLIFVGLGEGIAIYGLIISFMILNS